MVLELLGLELSKVPHAPHYIIVASHSSTALLDGYQASIGKGFKHISACFGTGEAAMSQLIRPISPPAHLPIFWLLSPVPLVEVIGNKGPSGPGSADGRPTQSTTIGPPLPPALALTAERSSPSDPLYNK